MISEEETNLLMRIGLTKNQTNVYLALLKLDEANAIQLARNTSLPSAVLYRTITELQKKGLIEQILSKPFRFKATTLNVGLQMLLDEKAQDYEELTKMAKILLLSRKSCRIEPPEKSNHNLRIIEGKKRIFQVMKDQHSAVQREVGILSTLNRWLQIVYDSDDEYNKALARKVKYNVILEAHEPENRIKFPENVLNLLEKPNFSLWLSNAPLVCNLAFFDEQEVTINFFPSKSLTESPIIVTRHPSFIRMSIDHFNAVLQSTQEYTLENNKNWGIQH
jgi:sugar-specific transcriptional regulator TrmB